MEKIEKSVKHPSTPFVRLDIDAIELISRQRAAFTVSIPVYLEPDEHFLVIDIYSEFNHVHPQGHIGWWRFDLTEGDKQKVILRRTSEGYNVTLNNKSAKESWINPEWAGAEDDILALHVVLRNAKTEAIEVNEPVPVYRSKDTMLEIRRRNESLQNDLRIATNLRTRWFFWPKNVTVRLVAVDVRENDAVGNFVFQLYKFLRYNKVPCQIYAQNYSSHQRGFIRAVTDLFIDITDKDLLFFHCSTFDPHLEAISKIPCRKICYYHSITPPRMFQIYDAELAVRSSKAFGQYYLLKAFDVLMANSEVSIKELRECLKSDESANSGHHDLIQTEERHIQKRIVCPPFLNARKWDAIEEEQLDIPEGGTILLYIGRISPHKKIEDLISLFEQYHHLDKDAKLVIIGSTVFQGYRNYIDHLTGKQKKNVQKNIFFRNGVSDSYLKSILGACSMYVSMSEHEGFCIPLVEAMAFGKPIFAFDQGAVRETMRRAGRLFHEKDFSHLAHEMYNTMHDDEELQKIIDAQNRRFLELASSVNGEAIWDAIEWALTSENSTL